VRGQHDVHAPVGLERAHVQIVVEQADVVDADLVAERLEDIQVGMGAALRAVGVAEQLTPERERRTRLPDAGRAVQEIGVRRPVPQCSLEEALGFVLLSNPIEHGAILKRRPNLFGQILLRQ
jgi:hypothetical protein